MPHDMPREISGDFPPVEAEQWRALVMSALKGRTFDRLVSKTYDDIAVEPLYARPAALLPLSRPPAEWRIAQRMDHPDTFEANRLGLNDLNGGANALALVGSAAATGRGFGVRFGAARDLADALADIDLDLISLRLEFGPQTPEGVAWLIDLAHARHLVAAGLDVDIGFDPLGDMLRCGRSELSIKAMAQTSAELGRKLRDAGFSARVLLADGRPFHEAGASEAQELAFVIASAVAHLRLLEAEGTPLDVAYGDIAFLLVADADAFLTIAKFRAMRALWARVAEACGITAPPARLHAETAWRMQSVYDPWVNILRNALAVFSAGVGGADTIMALPFTSALGLADEFARRLARNTQLIFLRESHLGVVADPAAGSGGIETLTRQLCEKAWMIFQKIEEDGGFIASLEAGGPQRAIAATAAARDKARAVRREVLTGTSEFPNLRELPINVLAPRPKAAERSLPIRPAELTIPALPSQRDGEMFEALRQRAEAKIARGGARPKVFLANLGTPSSFLARHAFAAAFFAIAGIEAAPDEGFASIAAACAAFRASGAKLACLCAADAQLMSDGKALAAELLAAGAAKVYAVAAPAGVGAELAGVTILHHGCDTVALLEDALALILVQRP